MHFSVKIGEPPRGRLATKAGEYILTVSTDGTPLLHGPYSTPRARTFVALQLASESQGVTLLLVDYSAAGMRVERFDAAAVADVSLTEAEGLEPDPRGAAPHSLAARGQPRGV
jgi:hypothetical protein